jgi:hypothetical protein
VPTRFGWAASIALVLSGVVYVAAWLVTGGEWSGPTSLRKPILFGLSTGVTLASLTWVASALPRRRGDGWWFGSLVLALLLEVALIDLQQARGVASHFNRSTPLDAFITSAMGGLILWATAVIVDFTARSFGRIDLRPDDARAARAGLVMLTLGCALGIAITLIGEAEQAAGRAPQVFGKAGVLKFAHGVPLHGIQIFFVQAWLLRRLSVPLAARLRSLAASIAGLAAFTAYGVVQTALGAPRWPPESVAWAFAASATLAFGAAAVVAWAGWRRSARFDGVTADGEA